MPDQANPKQVTVQEALNHIQEWIKSGEKEKAKQGLREILEFDPKNEQAKKMMTELEIPAPIAIPVAIPAKVFTPAPASASASATAPTPTPIVKPPTPTPMPIVKPTSTPTSAATSNTKSTPVVTLQKPQTPSTALPTADEFTLKKQKLQKIIAIIVSAIIFIGGGFFLYKTFFTTSADENSETVSAVSTEKTQSTAGEDKNSSEKVRRR